eukprot:6227579-Alexandrium_andersonii.AAC.1
MSPPSEWGAVKDHGAPGMRIFRIAGLFRKLGASQLLCKPCLNWVDAFRTAQPPTGRGPLPLANLESGGRSPFVFASDSTIFARPSEKARAGKSKVTSKDNKLSLIHI